MWKETRSFLPVPSQSEISRSAKPWQNYSEHFSFLKCHTESKAGCLNKMNTGMSSKATTNRRTWKFILRARKKSFSYPRQAETLSLSGSRQYHRGARWLSGRVSDSGARGRGFETYLRRVVSLSKTLYSPKVLVNYPGSGGSVPTWLKNCWLGR